MRYLLFLILMLVAMPSWATTYYVRSDGSSANCTGLSDAAYPGSGTGQACAWSTVNKVVGFTFADNDIIQFRYGDTFSDDYLRNAHANLTFRGYNSTGNGSKIPPILAGSSSYSASVLGNNQTFEKLKFSSYPIGGIASKTGIIFKYCIFTDISGTYLFQPKDSSFIPNCPISRISLV